jgi:hypothetical protein
MKTQVEVGTLKNFIAASEAALSLFEHAAKITSGDIYNDLHNATEDAKYLVAKAERRKYEPRYRDESDTDAELSPLERRMRDDKLTSADYEFIEEVTGISL